MCNAHLRSGPETIPEWRFNNELLLPTQGVAIEHACGADQAEAAQHSCEALRLAGDAIMTDTEAFCAALGKL